MKGAITLFITDLVHPENSSYNYDASHLKVLPRVGEFVVTGKGEYRVYKITHYVDRNDITVFVRSEVL